VPYLSALEVCSRRGARLYKSTFTLPVPYLTLPFSLKLFF